MNETENNRRGSNKLISYEDRISQLEKEAKEREKYVQRMAKSVIRAVHTYLGYNTQKSKDLFYLIGVEDAWLELVDGVDRLDLRYLSEFVKEFGLSDREDLIYHDGWQNVKDSEIPEDATPDEIRIAGESFGILDIR